MSEWLPYRGTWKGDILEAIIAKGLKYWNEILTETGLHPQQLNTALSELYAEGIIEKETDDSYKVIPEICRMYKRHYGEISKPVGKEDEESRIVFVVYGRNEDAREALFAFLRSIGLHPLEFSEAILKTGKGAPYIGEILDTAFSNAKAVIVLLTPDDEARLQEHYRKPSDPEFEKRLTPQARPNVLFEAGMALSRFPEQTILVQLGNLRPFSDISGRHTIQLDNTREKRKDLALRLRKAGCEISLSETDWHTAGDFEAAVPRIAILETGKRSEVETETPDRSEQSRKSILLPDNTDITRLSISNDFLDRLYRQAYRKAVGIYHDAKFTYLSIQVLPYDPLGSSVNIYMTFYSKWTRKTCELVYREYSGQLEHHPPDKRPQVTAQTVAFVTLPWKESPQWMQFLNRAYIKIRPLPAVQGTCYHLNCCNSSSAEKVDWFVRFEDGFSGNDYLFEWNGKGLDEDSIKQTS